MNTPYICPQTIEAAHQLAQRTAENLRTTGCTVDVDTDDNGLPVIHITTTAPVNFITLSVDVTEPEAIQ